ncbi:hypothetical protein ACJ73_07743, partial [Blastomyces percursus]
MAMGWFLRQFVYGFLLISFLITTNHRESHPQPKYYRLKHVTFYLGTLVITSSAGEFVSLQLHFTWPSYYIFLLEQDSREKDGGVVNYYTTRGGGQGASRSGTGSSTKSRIAVERYQQQQQRPEQPAAEIEMPLRNYQEGPCEIGCDDQAIGP